MSDTPKLYARRRPMELEPQYSAHMLAMTVENLRGKSEIAEELAVRDKCIVGLERENAALRAELEQVRKDADRYRHLRDHGGADLFGGTASMSIGRHPMIVYFAPSLNHANVVSLFAENADYMVDAAIDAVKGEK